MAERVNMCPAPERPLALLLALRLVRWLIATCISSRAINASGLHGNHIRMISPFTGTQTTVAYERHCSLRFVLKLSAFLLVSAKPGANQAV